MLLKPDGCDPVAPQSHTHFLTGKPVLSLLVLLIKEMYKKWGHI